MCKRSITYLFVFALKIHCECLSPYFCAIFILELDGHDVVPHLLNTIKHKTNCSAL